MILKNASIVDDDFKLRKADIEVEDGRITRVGENLSYSDKDLVVESDGFTVVPGFIDVHIHGSVGCDTGDHDKESIGKMAAYLLSKGVTTFCPTTMTVSLENVSKSIAAIKAYMDDPGEGATVAGVNLEGPFLSKAKKGAQNEDFLLSPNFETFKKLYDECGGIIKIADIAPEEEGGMDFARRASKLCTVSIAHTAADYETAKESFDYGITHATHLYNGMTGFSHRAPGVVGAVFDDERVVGELICDGYHIQPAVVRSTFKIMGDRISVISDALMMSGMPEGTESSLGGQHVSVKNGTAVLDNGTIAGSITNLHQELKNLVSWGIPLETAVKAMTINPARQLKMDKEIGSIRVGKKADLVILDENLDIVAVYH